ncbi:MAG: M20/M25/M40 family metallo-hydrolase [Bacteroidales bacterium]|nr:M20/M25/M40 family metallo-hydrolase [Bacteroidales bacterium]
MKRYLASMIQSVFILAGAKVEFSSAYPGWELSQESPLLSKAKSVYREVFGKEIKVNSVHCGLECGIIGSHYPKLDIISFGPTIHHPHSPQESVEIASVEKFWKYLTALLSSI